ncbi:MAG TPA: hypothetical protein VLB09_05110 [Nitrospiria bacterium]|nr:hypothetical protein [Nitrospiria bacterium]
MSSLPEKWKANEAKTDFILKFPGLMRSWLDCGGKTIDHVVPLPKGPGAVLIMSDHTFLVASPVDPDIRTIQEALMVIRPHLEDRYGGAYKELERLTEADRDLAKKSRLENILGAVRTNAPEIPELKKELQKLLDTLP